MYMKSKKKKNTQKQEETMENIHKRKLYTRHHKGNKREGIVQVGGALSEDCKLMRKEYPEIFSYDENGKPREIYDTKKQKNIKKVVYGPLIFNLFNDAVDIQSFKDDIAKLVNDLENPEIYNEINKPDNKDSFYNITRKYRKSNMFNELVWKKYIIENHDCKYLLAHHILHKDLINFDNKEFNFITFSNDAKDETPEEKDLKKKKKKKHWSDLCFVTLLLE